MDILIVMKILNGLTTGALYALTAFGLTFILGMLNIPNFAHGALYALAGYIAFSLAQVSGSYWIALLAAPLCMAMVGAVVERGLLRPLYGPTSEDENFMLLALFALAIILPEIIIMIWDASGQSLMPPAGLAGATGFFGFPYPSFRLFILAATALTILLSWLLIEKTRLGALIRAAIENREAVMMLGVDVRLLYAGSFAFGAALTALAGALSLPLRGIHPFIGSEILAMSFVIVVIGGLGNLYGAIFAGLLIGVLQEMSTFISPLAPWPVVYVAMIAVLLFRPTGLFGRR